MLPITLALGKPAWRFMDAVEDVVKNMSVWDLIVTTLMILICATLKPWWCVVYFTTFQLLNLLLVRGCEVLGGWWCRVFLTE